MKAILKPALVLLLICGIITLALAYVNQITEPMIAMRQAEDEVLARKAVLPEADTFSLLEEKVSDTIFDVYQGTRDGKTVGYTVNIRTTGYNKSTPVQAIVGVSTDLTITGITITGHAETPGLGSKMDDAGWLSQFLQKQVQKYAVVKAVPVKEDEVQAISGATISSRAMVNGVNEVLAYIGQLQEVGA